MYTHVESTMSQCRNTKSGRYNIIIVAVVFRIDEISLPLPCML